jgi:hypothetical protein
MTPLCVSQRCQCHCYACKNRVNDTAVQSIFSNILVNDPKHFDSAAQCTPHSGVIDTAVTSTAVSLTPLRHVQRYIWHRCNLHSSVNDKAVQIWHRSDFEPHIREALSLATFKGISVEKTYIGKLSFTIFITFTHKNKGVNYGLSIVSTVPLTSLLPKSAIS